MAFLHGPLGRVVGAVEDAAPAIGRGALNVATLGTYEHPHDTTRYLINTIQSLDPRTRAGLVNLAGIMVPGSRRGVPTASQQMMLNAIHASSRGAPGSLYGVDRPSVDEMAQHLGAPEGTFYAPLGMRNMYAAKNPADVIAPIVGKTKEPAYPAAFARRQLVGGKYVNMSAPSTALANILTTSFIQRRN